MWWLCYVDTVLPVGDIVFTLGILALGIYSITKTADVVVPQVSDEDDEKKEKPEPEPPDVTYPGDDPTVAPGDDYEWRGKEPVGGDKGAWVNKETGEQWHPDLNHKEPKGPHWDYTDVFGYVWSVFEDGRIIIWK